METSFWFEIWIADNISEVQCGHYALYPVQNEHVVKYIYIIPDELSACGCVEDVVPTLETGDMEMSLTMGGELETG